MIEICKLFNIEKGSLQSSKCTPGQYSFITAGEEWKTHIEYTHDSEALVFAMAASGSLGRTHYVNGKFIASDLCFILTPKKEYVSKVNFRFYSFYFNTYRQRIVKATATGTSKLAINRKSFSNYQIYLVDIEKQTQLLHKLDKMKSISDGLLQTIQQQQKYAEMLRQSILQQAVEGKLCEQDPNDEPASVLLEKIKAEKERLIAEEKIKKQKPLPPISDEEKPFALPKGWEWCRLPEIGELSRGKSKHRPRNDATLYKDGKYPLVQTGDVARAGTFITTYTALYNDVGLAQSRMWEKGTLCITIAANIADTGILSFDACFPDSVVGFQPFVPELDVEFFKWYIDISKKNLEKYAPATAQKNINIDILSSLIVPLPPKNELKKITRKTKNILALCDSLSHELFQSKQYAAQLMESVLQEAFSVQETAQPAQVIEFHPDQTTPETELLAAARGKIREDTWEHLCKRALEIAGEES